jgi:pimeloyl-ACP methyl ester carboxylesterase
MRRLLLAALVVLAALLAVNTIVTDNETKAAKEDLGRVLDFPDGDIQVREEGRRDRTPLVLLHGFASSMHWYTPLVERLRTDFRLIRVDLLGHGGSEKPDGGYSMEHQAELVAKVLMALRIERAVIVGHSMGGVVATAFAERNLARVEGLIVIGTPSKEGAGELPFLARLGFVPVLGEAIRRVVSDGMVKDNLEKAFAPGFQVPDQFVHDFNRMTYSSYDSSHHASDDFGDKKDVAERLRTLGKPLLAIQGAEDEFVEPDSVQEYRRVPRARIAVVPNTGHSPMVEQPSEVAGLIRAFARGLRLDRPRGG